MPAGARLSRPASPCRDVAHAGTAVPLSSPRFDSGGLAGRLAVYGADGVVAHQQFLRSALAQRLQRQRTGSIGVEKIHDRLLVDGSPDGRRG